MLVLVLLLPSCATTDATLIVLSWYREPVQCVDSEATWTPPEPAPLLVSYRSTIGGITAWKAWALDGDANSTDPDDPDVVVPCTDDVEFVYAVGPNE